MRPLGNQDEVVANIEMQSNPTWFALPACASRVWSWRALRPSLWSLATAFATFPWTRKSKRHRVSKRKKEGSLVYFWNTMSHFHVITSCLLCAHMYRGEGTRRCCKLRRPPLSCMQLAATRTSFSFDDGVRCSPSDRAESSRHGKVKILSVWTRGGRVCRYVL